jgi:hypothetical protein
MIISEQAFDFNLLQEIQQPQELNMMLKRIIENITIYNIGKKWRIKVYTETDTFRASFGMVKNELYF